MQDTLTYDNRILHLLLFAQGRESAGYYEPDKGFSYRINGRGQKFLAKFDMLPKLAAVSVADTDFQLCYLNPDCTRPTKPVNMGAMTGFVELI